MIDGDPGTTASAFAAFMGGKQLSPPRCRVAHAWLTAETYDFLQRAADRRRIHVDQLTAAIVNRFVEEAAVAAAIDGDNSAFSA